MKRGYSLVEVLLAIFILGIGLIMIATIFPVGANWTRQTTEDNVAQQVAQNAFAVIENQYTGTGPLAPFMYPDVSPGSQNSILTSANPTHVQPLPGFANIPLASRCFQFGSSQPFPSSDPTRAQYFYVALARLHPINYFTDAQVIALEPNAYHNGIRLSTSYTYNVYILVFRKGDSSQAFTDPAPATYALMPGIHQPGETIVPNLLVGPYNAGTYNASATPSVQGAVPAIGGFGIGEISGTCFRQIVSPSISTAIPSPLLLGQKSAPPAAPVPPTENVIVPMPADGTTSTGLVYIYQTTMQF